MGNYLISVVNVNYFVDRSKQWKHLYEISYSACLTFCFHCEKKDLCVSKRCLQKSFFIGIFHTSLTKLVVCFDLPEYAFQSLMLLLYKKLQNLFYIYSGISVLTALLKRR